MKVSIAWAFDHVHGAWQNYDIPALIARMSSTIGEIDGFEHIEIRKDNFFLAEVESCGAQETIVRIFERKKNTKLPMRPDAGEQGVFLVVAMDDGEFRWAHIADLGGSRKDLIPPLRVLDEEINNGSWREHIEGDDWVFEIDNKAVTHRPDLWGHRGFAREISAMLGLSYAAEEQVCMPRPVRHYDRKSPVIDISRPSACSRFAGIEVTDITYTPSILWMISRLARIDARGLNALVDTGNYVMFDLGLPMHVFDASAIRGGVLIPRFALSGEKLTLIDGDTVVLDAGDTVISDAEGALSLAGVMGGRDSGVKKTTTRIFLEGAHFDAAAIRKTAIRHKKRTEASARFEKSLDPNQNTFAINRYLTLLDDCKIAHRPGESIVSVGKLVPETEIVVSHRFLADRIGTAVTEGQVRTILTRLGFGIQTVDGASGLSYRVVVPTFRGTKDIKLPEDIVEEIARYFGYDTIVPFLPLRQMRSFDTNVIMRKRRLKRACAYSLLMREVDTYPLFDEGWLRQIAFVPTETVILPNPVSENWRQLVTTLIPHLLHAVSLNAIRESKLRFFEVGRIWHDRGIEGVDERHVCAGVFYQKSGLDFFDVKAAVEQLFDALGVLVDWVKQPDISKPSWAADFEVATLVFENRIIGHVGRVHGAFSGRVADGEIYAFEFETMPIFERKYDIQKCVPLSKYQEVVLDVSMFVLRTATVSEIEKAIALADIRIRDVELVDIFEKEEWGDRRSITMRYVIQDDEKTLVREEIDEVQSIVHRAVVALGAEIR